MSSSMRDEVAGELDLLSAAGGLLDAYGPRSTAKLFGMSPARVRFRNQVIEEYLDNTVPGTLGGLLQVVTAGPPGAGRSTATRELENDFRLVDADLVKDILLAEAETAGTFSSLLREELADGGTVMLRELGGLVHEESWSIAVELRRRCMKAGENVLVQTTLSYRPLISELLGDVAEHGYTGLHVVSVNVREAVALEQARQRWWDERCAGAPGGRYVPTSVIRGCYDGEESTCDRHATELHRRAQKELTGIVTTLGRTITTGDLKAPRGPDARS